MEAYLSRVKSLSWQAMQVRGTLTMAGDVAQDSAASAGGAATAGLKVPPRRFRRLAAAGSGAGALELLPETGGMSELAQLCQEAGLRGLFLTALKLPGR